MKLPPFEEIKRAYTRKACQRSLAEFVKAAWHILEPTTELKWNWAMDAICQHLEAVTNGDITRLCINVPPGFMKSLLTSVFWPAWEWGPKEQPQHRIIGTAHSKELAVRDSTKMRTLVESDWYQSLWPVALKDDQNAKSNFANSHEGIRASAAFTKLTGQRGSRLILDDPISAYDANSEVELKNAETAFMETLPSRINDEQSAIVVIMQRLHERDVTGIILDEGLAYVHLCLPMRFEMDRRCHTKIGFVDPRTYEGELLFPEFFPESRVAMLEKSLREFSTAGQLQQRPIPRDGGLFKREWFKEIDVIPNDIVLCRGYDLAASVKKGADFTATAKLGKTPDGKIIICDIQNEHLTAQGVQALSKQNAINDGVGCRISIPKDPGQASFTQVELFSQNLMGYDVRFTPESGDKQSRAMPLSAQAEAGNVYLLKGSWNAEFLDQICNFPNAKFDDQVDACSRAFSELLLMTRPQKAKASYYGGMII